MKEPDNLWIDLHYFPAISYFQQIRKCKALYLAIDEPYQKQSYQSRCHIRTAQGMQKLIIPTQHPRTGRPYRDIKIDYSTPWMKVHWHAITTAYNGTPYGELLPEMYRPFFERKPTYLLDLTLPILEKTLALFSLKCPIHLVKKSEVSAPYFDLYNRIHPKRFLPSDLSSSRTYVQHFSLPFMRDLSVIDLMACEGFVWVD